MNKYLTVEEENESKTKTQAFIEENLLKPQLEEVFKEGKVVQRILRSADGSSVVVMTNPNGL